MTALIAPAPTQSCTGCGVEQVRAHFPGARGRCRDCVNKARRESRSRNRERERDNNRRYYRDNREKARAYNLTKLYGITVEQYDAMVQAQHGVCALCSRPPDGKKNGGRLHVDHDHQTGVVRRLLCHHCNRGLGCFYDDPAALRRAADYIEAH